MAYFLTTTQATTNSPHPTINSPQIHHQKTTRKTSNPAKNAPSTIAGV
jgi:hypothetical protein